MATIWCMAAWMPLLLAGVSAFVQTPMQLASRRGPTAVARAPRALRPLLSSLRMGDDTMKELLGAAAAARAQMQASGPTDAGVLALSHIVGDGADAADGAGRKALLDALQADYAASVDEDVYAAPVPLLKMMPRADDRTAQRVAAFGAAAVPAAAVQEAAASGAGVADFTHRLMPLLRERARTCRERNRGWTRTRERAKQRARKTERGAMNTQTALTLTTHTQRHHSRDGGRPLPLRQRPVHEQGARRQTRAGNRELFHDQDRQDGGPYHGTHIPYIYNICIYIYIYIYNWKIQKFFSVGIYNN
jgi:hypothetical protein